MVLYSDRVFCFERLAELEPDIRSASPDEAMLNEFVETDIRNQLAFMELTQYEKHKTFIYEHPLTLRHKKANDLDALRKANPARFTSELINADKNITRYRSYIENNKYKDEKERQSWLSLVESYTEKKEIMQRLLAGN